MSQGFQSMNPLLVKIGQLPVVEQFLQLLSEPMKKNNLLKYPSVENKIEKSFKVHFLDYSVFVLAQCLEHKETGRTRLQICRNHRQKLIVIKCL